MTPPPRIPVRQMTTDDFPTVYSLVKATKVLDVHRPYTYWIMHSLSPALMMVAEQESAIVGFVGGFGPYLDADTVFLWQIGVAPEMQRRGIGSALLDEFTARASGFGFRRLCFSVAESNEPSFVLFSKLSERLGCPMNVIGETGDFGGELIPEIIYEIQISEVNTT